MGRGWFTPRRRTPRPARSSARVGAVAGFLFACFVITTACAGGSPPAAAIRIQATPAQSLFDQPVTLVVSGLSPSEIAQLSVTANVSGATWAATARYRADRHGEISLGDARSLGGGYVGSVPMGLFVSMRPVSPTHALNPPPMNQAEAFTISVLTAGKVRGSTTVERRHAAPGVTATPESLAAVGFVGQYWAPPPGTSRHAAVLEFGGSEGGLQGQLIGAALASRGYPTHLISRTSVNQGFPRNSPTSRWSTSQGRSTGLTANLESIPRGCGSAACRAGVRPRSYSARTTPNSFMA